MSENSFATELIGFCLEADGFDQFAREATAAIRNRFDCAGAGLFHADKGRWIRIAAAGQINGQVDHVLSDALDEPVVVQSGELVARVVDQRQADPVVLLLAGPRAWKPDQFEEAARALAPTLAEARDAELRRQRIARLETILAIAARWNQTLDVETLLVDMAEAATKLLEAERASIFLWDRAHRTLVGRPALGVEGGELRIPDDAGVVGHVFQSGEPRRVDEDIATEQQQIDRRVDEQLEFKTRNLLCVPLRSRGGEMFGAF